MQSHPAPAPLIVRSFNELQDYATCFERMRNFSTTRDSNTPDQCWILQHHAVLTQGQAGKPEHIVAPTQLPVVHSDRGGQVTWHGPGQLIVYFLFDLKRLGWHVRDLVTFTENAMIEVLQQLGLVAYAKADAPGVYIDKRKIGSLGFKIRQGCSYHGLSLNIDCTLDGFAVINPCGYADLQMLRLSDLCHPCPSHEKVAELFVNYLTQTAVFRPVMLKNDD